MVPARDAPHLQRGHAAQGAGQGVLDLGLPRLAPGPRQDLSRGALRQLPGRAEALHAGAGRGVLGDVAQRGRGPAGNEPLPQGLAGLGCSADVARPGRLEGLHCVEECRCCDQRQQGLGNVQGVGGGGGIRRGVVEHMGRHRALVASDRLRRIAVHYGCGDHRMRRADRRCGMCLCLLLHAVHLPVVARPLGAGHDDRLLHLHHRAALPHWPRLCRPTAEAPHPPAGPEGGCRPGTAGGPAGSRGRRRAKV
mmetsp:Transcript_75271/g.211058  ORF Transcript_75271/g.211058 Transcript_75271/m.211058 type:complete len:251 (-) Transcript_75271:425-1177(-)